MQGNGIGLAPAMFPLLKDMDSVFSSDPVPYPNIRLAQSAPSYRVGDPLLSDCSSNPHRSYSSSAPAQCLAVDAFTPEDFVTKPKLILLTT